MTKHTQIGRFERILQGIFDRIAFPLAAVCALLGILIGRHPVRTFSWFCGED